MAEYNSVNAALGFVNIELRSTALKRAGILLERAPEKVKIAISHAVNRSLEAYKTASLRETAKKYYVKQKDIRASLTLKKSYGGAMNGAVIAKGPRRSLTEYKFAPRKGPTASGKVSAAVKKAGGLKHMRTARLTSNSFGAPVILIYNEESKRWRRATSPSVPQLMKNQETMDTAQQKSGEVFEQRLQHELGRIGFLP